MFLEDRKKRILKSIIDDYITTAEPVGSRAIARKYELGLSSATIRLEMADLEELGFLMQPYTSAGRVPSDKGYRFYVDELMDLEKLTVEQIQNIRRALKDKINEVEQLVRMASSILSNATNYTSMATAPSINSVIVKTIQLVWVDDKKILVVLVVDGNIIKNALKRLSLTITKDDTNILTNLINEKITGIPLQQIEQALNSIEYLILGIEPKLFREVLGGILECVSQIDVVDYFLEGTKNILNFPEFKDLDKARLFLEMMDKKEYISTMLKTQEDARDMNIQIGQENEIIEARDCSVVITSYSLGDSIIGSIGIIGPTRMEYAKVIKYMNHIRKMVNEEIQKLVSD